METMEFLVHVININSNKINPKNYHFTLWQFFSGSESNITSKPIDRTYVYFNKKIKTL